MRPIDPKDWSEEDRQQAREECQVAARRADEALAALNLYWRATDPDFEAKAPRLCEAFNALAVHVSSGAIHPSHIVALVQEIYETVSREFAEAGETRSIH